MPAWTAAGTTSLSSGDKLQVLLATDASPAGGFLQGFTFLPQPSPLVLTIFNDSPQTVAIQVSPDNINWLPLTIADGVAVTFPTDTAISVTVGSGLYYRLTNATAIVAGGTIWVAR
jgi:hypothetical protein